MNTFARAFIGVFVLLSSTLSFAVDTGTEVSAFTLKGGLFISGTGSGKGHWGINPVNPDENEYSNLFIHDTSTHHITLANLELETSTHLHYSSPTNEWDGTVSVLKCKDLSNHLVSIDACKFIKIAQPMDIKDIKVDLDSDNLGTVSGEIDFKVSGHSTSLKASYKLAK